MISHTFALSSWMYTHGQNFPILKEILSLICTTVKPNYTITCVWFSGLYSCHICCDPLLHHIRSAMNIQPGMNGPRQWRGVGGSRWPGMHLLQIRQMQSQCTAGGDFRKYGFQDCTALNLQHVLNGSCFVRRVYRVYGVTMLCTHYR